MEVDCAREPLCMALAQLSRFRVGPVTAMAAYGFFDENGRWLFPARGHLQLEPWQAITPEFQKPVDYSATQLGSYAT